jgi:chromosome segregation ATPase
MPSYSSLWIEKKRDGMVLCYKDKSSRKREKRSRHDDPHRECRRRHLQLEDQLREYVRDSEMAVKEQQLEAERQYKDLAATQSSLIKYGMPIIQEKGDEIVRLSHRSNKLADENSTLKRERSQVYDEMGSLKLYASKLDDDITTLKFDKMRLSDEIGHLKHRNGELDAEAAHFMERSAYLLSMAYENEDRAKKLEEKHRRVQTMANKFEQDWRTAEAIARGFESDKARLIERNNDLRTHNTFLSKRVSHLEHEHATLSDSNRYLLGQTGRLETELGRLQNDCSSTIEVVGAIEGRRARHY